MNHTNNPDVVRCALYLRKATDDRASLLQQEEACRAAAAKQNPAWRIVEDAVFKDSGTSGLRANDRPGLAALLKRAAECPRSFDYVITDTPDRLGRDLVVTSKIASQLTHHGVGMYFASLDLDSADPRFDYLLAFTQWHGYQISRVHGESVARGQHKALHQGGSVGGRCYGYRSHPVYAPSTDRCVVCGMEVRIAEHEAEIVRNIFRDFADGLSAGEISRRLNADEVTGPAGGFWRASSVLRVLRCSRYRGTTLWNRTCRLRNPHTGRVEYRPRPAAETVKVQASHLRIVDDELAARVDARLRKRRG